jgi:tetratricopeptide (TPR) repeat protein
MEWLSLQKPRRRTSKPPTLRKRFSKLSRAQAIFSILAVLVVCSLLATTLGSAVYDDLRNDSSSGNPQTENFNSTDDPVLNQMRADAQASPNDPSTLAALANYLANTGQTDEAIQWYEKAIALKRSDSDLRLDFGIALSKGEKYADAEVQFKKVIAAVPNYAQAYLSLGQLYLDWIPPRDADAIVAFNKAISLDPTSVVADRARDELSRIVSGTPVASPAATP